MKFSEDYFGGPDKKDDSLEPPAPGYTRHQYFLAIDGPTFDNWTQEERKSWLVKYFVTQANLLLTEVMLDTPKWVVYRLWMDLPNDY